MALGGVVWDWSRPYLLGIVNVTPDSFSDGGRFLDPDRAIAQGLELLREGADALDIGGQSTRPGAEIVPEEIELQRVLPVLRGLRRATAAPLSVDTFRARVAREALGVGANIVNDTGLGDPPEALGAIAQCHGSAYIAMHARGTPTTMGALTEYDDVVGEVCEALGAVAARLQAVGVPRGRILLDPGVGFAKTAEQSLRVLARLAPLKALGYPLCVGVSRKSFLVASEPYRDQWDDAPGEGRAGPTERLGGTAAAVALAVWQGAAVLRVHDVGACRQAARVAHALSLRG
ncbi:MAG: dihydropteroate synthase [Deltaproteobacteria bacterium]|nr:dihydropteroate synthase [Deltaproteobacteria bacterium]